MAEIEALTEIIRAAILADARGRLELQPDGMLYCSDSNMMLDPSEIAKAVWEGWRMRELDG